MIVYSLICWGGRRGKSVTASNSSGLIFTLTNHGLRDGTGIVFSGTTAPGNVTFGTTYYTKSLSTSTFAIYTDSALTNRVAWSSAGSGVIAKSKRMLDYFDQYPGRWGDSGSERCYDGLAAWVSGRSSASPVDEEVCEIGEAFSEIGSTVVSINIPAGATRVSTHINGVRTPAFHNGKVPTATPTLENGFILHRVVQGSSTALSLSKDNISIDGFSVFISGSGYTYSGVSVSITVVGCSVSNMISVGRNDGTGSGFGVQGQGTKFTNNLAMLFGYGFNIAQYAYGVLCANNIAVGNTYGFKNDSSPMLGYYYNNISVGNTTGNWTTVSTSSIDYSSNNAGLRGEAWVVGTGASRLTIATTDFADYANRDFRPALATSPQVDSGMLFYGAIDRDIADDERPNYNNGGSEAVDVGCYEYDHGYGNHPITATLTLAGLASGTDVVVRAAGSSTILDSVDSTSGNWTYTYGSAHNVDIDVIKPGMVIVTFRNLALTAESSTLPVSQQFDRNYS